MTMAPLGRFRAATFVVVAAASVPAAALAGVLTLQPELTIGAEYSTNPQLRLDGASGGEAALARVGLPLEWTNNVDRWTLTPRARLGVSGGDSALGANAYYLAGAGDLSWELSKLALKAQLSDDSSVVRQPDAGTLTRSDVRQHGVDASVDWSRALTERVTIDVAGSIQNATYGHRTDIGLYDFRVRGVTGEFSRRMSQRISLQIMAGRSRYELPDTNYENVNTYQQAGFFGQISPQWSFKALLGRSRVSARGARRSPTGAAYVASVNRDGERVSLAFSFVRNLQPSGFGVMVQAREVSTRISWGLSERKSLFATARRVTTSDVFGSLTFSERSYDAASAGVLWQVSPYWDVNAEASYTRISIVAGLLDAAANGRGTGALVSAVRHFGRVRLK